MNTIEARLDEILDNYYAPIKLPDDNRAGLKQAIKALITERVKLGRVNERKMMSSELEELSDFAFVNYPNHELDTAIRDYWRKNDERLAELRTALSRYIGGSDE